MKRINSIRNAILSIVALLIMSFSAKAQLNGTYTIGGTSPDYTTLKAAINALNNNGVNGPVTFLIRSGTYSGSSWMGSIGNVSGASNSNRITFRSQSGNNADVVLKNNNSANYTFRFNNASYITVRDITLQKTGSARCRIFDFGSTQASHDSVINCVLKAPATTSSADARALVYGYGHTGTDNVFYNNEFNNGGHWVFMRGSGTTSTSKSFKLINNEFKATNSGYRGIYTYYTDGLKIIGNTINRTGSGTYYTMYNYYADKDVYITDNDIYAKSSSTLYGLHLYYANYTSKSPTLTPVVSDNNVTIEGGSGTTYPLYHRYGDYGVFENNIVSGQNTSGTMYVYMLYQHSNYLFENNTINLTKTSSSGTMYFYGAYNSSNYPNDTFRNNTINLTRTSGGTLYNRMVYYGGSAVIDNEFNVSNTSGTTYNEVRYANGAYFAYNKVNASTTTGTLYGCYNYGSSSYSGGDIVNNDFNLQSNSGTVYGMYPYYSKSNIKNNLVTTKTSGTNYTLYVRYNYGSYIGNNTFYSQATGSTNYLSYIYNTSSSYSTEIKNNIFSRSSNSGTGVYSYNKNYFEADYNLYYIPGGTMFNSNSPSYSGSSLQQWRNKTGSDMNSLIYEVPFVDPGNRDFHIDPNSPAAWAVNGRADHDTTIVTDLSGIVRPKFVQDGVPDLGAYEVSPTSTPPNAVATPTDPVANSSQVFTFGQDTVATIDWGATVPSTYTMRQYTGVQAMPMPAGVGRMYFYVAGTPSSWVHPHTPHINYKEPWVGDISNGENEAVIARSSNNGAWEGYNFTNAATDITNNVLSPAAPLDSVGSYTGVQNGRIGIRCVENPKGITITNITANEADIEWQPVFNPLAYQVVLKTTYEAPTTTEWANSSLPTTNSLAASGLTEDTKYYVFVRSICGINDTSGYSADSFITLITCHDPVITVSDITDSRAVISWQNVKTAVKYEYVMTETPGTPGSGTDINKTSVLAPFLDPGTTYYVHVRAHCSDIYPNSNWSTASFMTEWPTGVNDITAGNGLSIYPNPVNNELMLEVAGDVEDATVSIIDMTGKLLQTNMMTGNKLTMDVSSLPSGMYILQYTDADNNKQVKFNKQ